LLKRGSTVSLVLVLLVIAISLAINSELVSAPLADGQGCCANPYAYSYPLLAENGMFFCDIADDVETCCPNVDSFYNVYGLLHPYPQDYFECSTSGFTYEDEINGELTIAKMFFEADECSGVDLCDLVCCCEVDADELTGEYESGDNADEALEYIACLTYPDTGIYDYSPGTSCADTCSPDGPPPTSSTTTTTTSSTTSTTLEEATTTTVPEAYCGDGTKDFGEECDSRDFDGQVCEDFNYLGHGFENDAGGNLLCIEDCEIGLANCLPVCGDEEIHGSEECEADNDCEGEGIICVDCSCALPEDCTNNEDDDGDDLVDCADNNDDIGTSCYGDDQPICYADGEGSSHRWCSWYFDPENSPGSKKCCTNAIDCDNDDFAEICDTEFQGCPEREHEFPTRTIIGYVEFKDLTEDGEYENAMPQETHVEVALSGAYKFEIQTESPLSPIGPDDDGNYYGEFTFEDVPTHPDGAYYVISVMHPDYYVGTTATEDYQMFNLTIQLGDDGNIIEEQGIFRLSEEYYAHLDDEDNEVLIGDIIMYDIPEYGVSGHVYDADEDEDESMQGATVTVLPEGEDMPAAIVDGDDNAYSISDLSEHSYTLKAYLSDYISEYQSFFLGETLSGVDFYLQAVDCFFGFSAPEIFADVNVPEDYPDPDVSVNLFWPHHEESFPCADEADYYTLYRQQMYIDENDEEQWSEYQILENNILPVELENIADDEPAFTDSSVQTGTTYKYKLAVAFTYPYQIWVDSNEAEAVVGDHVCYVNEPNFQPDEVEYYVYCEENSGYYCDPDKRIVFIKDCLDTQTCVFNRNEGDGIGCIDAVVCAGCNAQLGLFASSSTYEIEDIPGYPDMYCEDATGFCYLDRTNTSIDMYSSCSEVSKCYNYMSEGACNANACRVYGEIYPCEWQYDSRYGQFGVGVCRPKDIERQDCNICNTDAPYLGDEGVSYADLLTNKVFEQCDRSRCELYAGGDGQRTRCYYDIYDELGENNYYNTGHLIEIPDQDDDILTTPGGACQNRRDLSCLVYDNPESCTGGPEEALINADVDVEWENGVKIGGTNAFVNAAGEDTRSDDLLNLGTCVWTYTDMNMGFCTKNAEGRFYDEEELEAVPDCLHTNPNIYACHIDNTVPATQVNYLPVEQFLDVPYFVNYSEGNFLDVGVEDGYTTRFCTAELPHNLLMNPGFERRRLFYWNANTGDENISISIDEEDNTNARSGTQSLVFTPFLLPDSDGDGEADEFDNDGDIVMTVQSDPIDIDQEDRGNSVYVLVAPIMLSNDFDNVDISFSAGFVSAEGESLINDPDDPDEGPGEMQFYDNIEQNYESREIANSIPEANDGVEYHLLYARYEPNEEDSTIAVSLNKLIESDDSLEGDANVYFDDIVLLKFKTNDDGYVIQDTCYPNRGSTSRDDGNYLTKIDEDGKISLRFFSEDGSHNLEVVQDVDLEIDHLFFMDVMYDDSDIEQIGVNEDDPPEEGLWVTNLDIYAAAMTDEHAICYFDFGDGDCSQKVLPSDLPNLNSPSDQLQEGQLPIIDETWAPYYSVAGDWEFHPQQLLEDERYVGLSDDQYHFYYDCFDARLNHHTDCVDISLIADRRLNVTPYWTQGSTEVELGAKTIYDSSCSWEALEGQTEPESNDFTNPETMVHSSDVILTLPEDAVYDTFRFRIDCEFTENHVQIQRDLMFTVDLEAPDTHTAFDVDGNNNPRDLTEWISPLLRPPEDAGIKYTLWCDDPEIDEGTGAFGCKKIAYCEGNNCEPEEGVTNEGAQLISNLAAQSESLPLEGLMNEPRYICFKGYDGNTVADVYNEEETECLLVAIDKFAPSIESFGSDDGDVYYNEETGEIITTSSSIGLDGVIENYVQFFDNFEDDSVEAIEAVDDHYQFYKDYRYFTFDADFSIDSESLTEPGDIPLLWFSQNSDNGGYYLALHYNHNNGVYDYFAVKNSQGTRLDNSLYSFVDDSLSTDAAHHMHVSVYEDNGVHIDIEVADKRHTVNVNTETYPIDFGMLSVPSNLGIGMSNIKIKDAEYSSPVEEVRITLWTTTDSMLLNPDFSGDFDEYTGIGEGWYGYNVDFDIDDFEFFVSREIQTVLVVGSNKGIQQEMMRFIPDTVYALSARIKITSESPQEIMRLSVENVVVENVVVENVVVENVVQDAEYLVSYAEVDGDAQWIDVKATFRTTDDTPVIILSSVFEEETEFLVDYVTVNTVEREEQEIPIVDDEDDAGYNAYRVEFTDRKTALLPNAINMINLYARDEAGNELDQDISIKTDNTGPDITVFRMNASEDLVAEYGVDMILSVNVTDDIWTGAPEQDDGLPSVRITIFNPDGGVVLDTNNDDAEIQSVEMAQDEAEHEVWTFTIINPENCIFNGNCVLDDIEEDEEYTAVITALDIFRNPSTELFSFSVQDTIHPEFEIAIQGPYNDLTFAEDSGESFIYLSEYDDAYDEEGDRVVVITNTDYDVIIAASEPLSGNPTIEYSCRQGTNNNRLNALTDMEEHNTIPNAYTATLRIDSSNNFGCMGITTGPKPDEGWTDNPLDGAPIKFNIHSAPDFNGVEPDVTDSIVAGTYFWADTQAPTEPTFIYPDEEPYYVNTRLFNVTGRQYEGNNPSPNHRIDLVLGDEDQSDYLPNWRYTNERFEWLNTFTERTYTGNIVTYNDNMFIDAPQTLEEAAHQGDTVLIVSRAAPWGTAVDNHYYLYFSESEAGETVYAPREREIYYPFEYTEEAYTARENNALLKLGEPLEADVDAEKFIHLSDSPGPEGVFMFSVSLNDSDGNDLPEGQYYIYPFAVDGNGLVNEWRESMMTIVFDETPPVISNIAPSNGNAFPPDTDVRIAFTLEDSESEIINSRMLEESIKVKITTPEDEEIWIDCSNGCACSRDQDTGIYSVVYDYPTSEDLQGEFEITYYGTDQAGNAYSGYLVTRTFYVIENIPLPPRVEISDGVDDWNAYPDAERIYTRVLKPSFDVVYSDELQVLIKSAAVYGAGRQNPVENCRLEGEDIQLEHDNTYSLTLPELCVLTIADGRTDYELKLVAVYEVNQDVDPVFTIPFTIDNQAPQIVFADRLWPSCTGELTGQYLDRSADTLMFTQIEPPEVQDGENVRLALANNPFELGENSELEAFPDNSVTLQRVGLCDDGTQKTVEALIVDMAGNQAQKSAVITVDRVAPVWGDIQPTATSPTRNNLVSLSGVLTDNYDVWDGQGLILSTAVDRVDITVELYDEENSEYVVTQEIVIEEFDIIPGAGAQFTQSVDLLDFELIAEPEITDGTYRITLVPYDTIGNEGEARPLTVALDQTEPDIIFTSPGRITSAQLPTITASVEDVHGLKCDDYILVVRNSDNEVIVNIEDDVDYCTNDENTYITYTPEGEPWAQGEYTATVSVKDTLGNPANSYSVLSYTFEIDREAPPEPTVSLSDGSGYVNVATDEGIQVISVPDPLTYKQLVLNYGAQEVEMQDSYVTIAGGESQPIGCDAGACTSCTCYLPPQQGDLQQGRYQLELNTERTDNHELGASRPSFILDYSAPTLRLGSVPESPRNTREIELTVRTTDVHPATISITGPLVQQVLEDVNAQTYENTYALTLSGADGQKIIIITATDEADNSEEERLEIFLDTTPPGCAPELDMESLDPEPTWVPDSNPPRGAIATNALTVEGSVSCITRNEGNLLVYINSELASSYDLDLDNDFEANIVLQGGENVIDFNLTDTNGNVGGGETIIINYIDDPPELYYVLPIPDSVVREITFAEAALMPSELVSLDMERSSLALTGSDDAEVEGTLTHEQNVMTLDIEDTPENDIYTISVEAIDALGNSAVYGDMAFTLNDAVPSITINNEPVGAVYYTTEISVDLSVTVDTMDDNLALTEDGTYYTVDNVDDGAQQEPDADCAGRSCTFTVTLTFDEDEPTDTERTLSVTATSTNGAAFTGGIRVIRDATPPELQLNMPVVTMDNTPSFSVVSNEIVQDCTYILDQGDETDFDGNDGLWYTTTIGENLAPVYTDQIEHSSKMQTGHSMEVTCTDIAGNEQTQEFNFDVANPKRDQIFYMQNDKVRLKMILEARQSYKFEVSGVDLFGNEVLSTAGDEAELVSDGNGVYYLEFNTPNQLPDTLHPRITITGWEEDDYTGDEDDDDAYTMQATMYLSLHAAASWSSEDVQAAVGCFKGFKGFYDELYCSWASDVGFTLKANLAGDLSSCRYTGGSIDGFCADSTCKTKFYGCRRAENIPSAVNIDDPGGLDHSVFSQVGVYVYYTYEINPNAGEDEFGRDLIVWFTSAVSANRPNMEVAVAVDYDTMRNKDFDVYVNGEIYDGDEVTESENQNEGLFFYNYGVPEHQVDINEYVDVKFVIHDVPADADANILRFFWGVLQIDNKVYSLVNTAQGEGEQRPEYCRDRVDNDLSMSFNTPITTGRWNLDYVDCRDPSCQGVDADTGDAQKICRSAGEYDADANIDYCNDGFDNDGDGYRANTFTSPYAYAANPAIYDCYDNDCFQESADCPETEAPNCNNDANDDYDYGLFGREDISVSLQDKQGNYIVLKDCLDTQCNNVGYCEYENEQTCDDGYDNDADIGYVPNTNKDCVVSRNGNDQQYESDCDRWTAEQRGVEYVCPEAEEVCNDWLDNDMDSRHRGDEGGFIYGVDCQDEDCNWRQGDGGTCIFQTEWVNEETAYLCADNFDNDANGQTDCTDESCAGHGNATCGPCSTVESYKLDSCSDNLDNDGDELIDCYDTDCAGLMGPEGELCPSGEEEEVELTPNEFGPGMCNDGINNDGVGNAGGVDRYDSDCAFTPFNGHPTGTASFNTGDGIRVTYPRYVFPGQRFDVRYDKNSLSRSAVFLSLGSADYPVENVAVMNGDNPDYSLTNADQFSRVTTNTDSIILESEGTTIENLDTHIILNHLRSNIDTNDDYQLPIYANYENANDNDPHMLSFYLAPDYHMTIPRDVYANDADVVEVETDGRHAALSLVEDFEWFAEVGGIYGCRFVYDDEDDDYDANEFVESCEWSHTFPEGAESASVAVTIWNGVRRSKSFTKTFALTPKPESTGFYSIYLEEQFTNYPERAYFSSDSFIPLFTFVNFTSPSGFPAQPDCEFELKYVNGSIFELPEYAFAAESEGSGENGMCAAGLLISQLNLTTDYYSFTVSITDSAGQIGTTEPQPLWICPYKINPATGEYTCMDQCEIDTSYIDINITRPPYDGWPEIQPYRINPDIESVVVSGTIDNRPGVELLVMNFNQQNLFLLPIFETLHPENGEFEFEMELLEGVNAIIIAATAGGVGYTSITIERDIAGPEIVTFLPGEFAQESTPLLEIFLDENATECLVDVYDDGISWQSMTNVNNSYFTYQLTDITPLIHNDETVFRFNCIDIFGNSQDHLLSSSFDPASVYLIVESSAGSISGQGNDFVTYEITHKTQSGHLMTTLSVEDRQEDEIACSITCSGSCSDNNQYNLGDGLYAIQHQKIITFTEDYVNESTDVLNGSFVYEITCDDQTGYSDTKYLNLNIRMSNLAITDYYPHGFIRSTTTPFYVVTNYESRCMYGTSGGSQGLINYFGQQGYTLNHSTTLNLAEGTQTYYVNCTPEIYTSGNYAELVLSFQMDIYPPSSLTVNALPKVCDNTRLHADWTAEDNISGISHYEYAVGTGVSGAAASTIVNFTSTTDNEATLTGLNLTEGGTYYWNVKAYDHVGLSISARSNGTKVDPQACIPTCTDGIRNQNETGVDCGGGSCAACQLGRPCVGDSDCAEGKCINQTCTIPHCINGELDGDESDVDCGGSCDECSMGEDCRDDEDCASNYCSDDKCTTPSCTDGEKNGFETDADCGGPQCDTCDIGSSCDYNSDCITNVCDADGLCAEPSCTDGIKSPGFESDVDCGIECPPCEEGKTCGIDSDCISENCQYSMCSPPIPYEQRDTDGDGLPDWWELENGLDPNDPNDAMGDLDLDMLTNLQEFREGTKPNQPDTDGDGFDDGLEVTEGFDPLDPSSYPKSHIVTILILIISIAVLLSGGGYLGYKEYTKRKKKKQPPVKGPPGRPGAPGAARPSSGHPPQPGHPMLPSQAGKPPPKAVYGKTPASAVPPSLFKPKTPSAYTSHVSARRKKELDSAFSTFDEKDTEGAKKYLEVRAKESAKKSAVKKKPEAKKETEDEWLTLSDITSPKAKKKAEELIKSHISTKLASIKMDSKLKQEIAAAKTQKDKDDVFSKLQDKLSLEPEKTTSKQKQDVFDMLKTKIDSKGKTVPKLKIDDKMKSDVFAILKNSVLVDGKGDVFAKLKEETGKPSDDVFEKLKAKTGSKTTHKSGAKDDVFEKLKQIKKAKKKS